MQMVNKDKKRSWQKKKNGLNKKTSRTIAIGKLYHDKTATKEN